MSALKISSGLALAALFATTLAGQAAEPLTLPDTSYFPEGIAVDQSGGLYLGSLTKGGIIHIDPATGQVNPFAAEGANGMVSVIGVLVSADDGLVYACSSDPGASQFTGKSPSAVVAFNRTDGSSAGRYELPEGGAFCNDLTEQADGTILATDSFAPRIYALKPGSDKLEIWLEDPQFVSDGFNLNGIAATSDAVYMLRYNTGQLFRVEVKLDGSSGAVTAIDLGRKLNGPDGLKALSDTEFLVVEGGGLTAGSRGALTRIVVAGDTGVLSTIKDDMNLPTTAVVKDGIAYVVEAQLDHLFDAENAGPPDPFQIVPVAIK